jgi:hypothetical protein
MILVDNRRWIGRYNRNLAENLKEIEESLTDRVIAEESREGLLTLKVELDGKYQYLHSKYKPSQDVDRLLKKYEDEDSSYVLFWGVGLGYHIDEFTKKYPNRKFSIYEPNEEVFYQYVKHSKLSTYRGIDVLTIQTGLNKYTLKMTEVIKKSRGKLQIIALPVYEKSYSSQFIELHELLIEAMKYRKVELQADLGFQQRWTLNAVKNFPTVIQTPNFLQNEDWKIRDSDVAVIVAAGPSLNYEYENLRYVLNEGLAYVFAVGSAINALVKKNIHPHAFVSYDPKEKNQRVSKLIKERGIEDIPIVFGSSIGYETIEDYPGVMYHFHTNQDHISPYLITKELPTVNDAPSVAVITLQLLLRLGFKKIVFIGQNLAFSGDYRHAQGISYEGYQSKITKEEKEILYVLDVVGNEIKTKESFESMRQQLEMYIDLALNYDKEIHFVNTTKGGAQIKNAEYIPLKQLIEGGYFNKVDVDTLFPTKSNYSLTSIRSNLERVKRAEEQLEKEVDATFEQLKKIQKAMDLKRVSQIDSLFVQYDQTFAKVEKNIYYRAFVKSILRVQFDQVAEQIENIKYENNVMKKAQIIIVAFNTYLNYILQAHNFIRPHFIEMWERVSEVREHED